MPITYNHLTPDERDHFVKHGWLKVENAIKKEFIDEWMSHLWDRLGWDENDKSTWDLDYLKMPRHKEVPVEQFCPEAWAKMCEMVGGVENIDPKRDRWFGDQFIVNFGNKDLVGTDWNPQTSKGWHTDNDFFRQFLDSGELVLTVICLFTDSDALGGPTVVCEDGIKDVCQAFYDHPEGEDTPFESFKPYEKVPQHTDYQYMYGKAGDIIITHVFLPHASSPNRRHNARVISNPHVCLRPGLHLSLNRADGDYNLVEQVILHHMGRTSIPEYKNTRPRIAYYPRNGFFKRARVGEELDRMIAAAKRQGLPESSVGSIYQGSAEEIKEHEARNGYDKPWGPKGVQLIEADVEGKLKTLDGVMEGQQVFTYKTTGAQSVQVRVSAMTAVAYATMTFAVIYG